MYARRFSAVCQEMPTVRFLATRHPPPFHPLQISGHDRQGSPTILRHAGGLTFR